MIEGVVNALYEPVVPLSLQGPAGRALQVEAVIDTGYNGLLALPPPVVVALGLARLGSGEASLADGSVVSFDIYSVTVSWDGRLRHIEVDEADTTPLVGMLLLDGYDLNIRVREGGRVLIQALA